MAFYAVVEALTGDIVDVKQYLDGPPPDATLDEALAAAILLRPGATVSEAELTAHCRAALAAYKRPRRWRFIAAADLPLTTTGKLQRNRLPELFVEE